MALSLLPWVSCLGYGEAEGHFLDLWLNSTDFFIGRPSFLVELGCKNLRVAVKRWRAVIPGTWELG